MGPTIEPRDTPEITLLNSLNMLLMQTHYLRFKRPECIYSIKLSSTHWQLL